MASIKPKNTEFKARDSKAFVFQYDLLKVMKYQQIRNKFAFLMSQENVLGCDKDVEFKDR